MQAGAEVVYQAALVVPPWLGFADFLERVLSFEFRPLELRGTRHQAAPAD